MFTMEEVDMVLYGYAKAKDVPSTDRTGSTSVSGHALSGLRIGELSYGEYINMPVFVDFCTCLIDS